MICRSCRLPTQVHKGMIMNRDDTSLDAMQGYPFYPVGPKDQERVEYLSGLKVLDSNTEVEYEMICRLAAIHFHMPIVTISLVDSERQWFKSHLGLTACETTRDLAFCNYTVLSDKVFEVLDATKDARFRENPLVTGELSIRYYCGFPIILNGYAVGAFCLISTVPRETPLSVDDREFGMNCARIVARMLEKRKLLRESVNRIEQFLMMDNDHQGTGRH